MDDYRDLLRVRDLPIWEKESREARFVRQIGSDPDVTYGAYREFCETRSLEVVANIAIWLIHQTNDLLDQQLRRLERDFVREGGLRQRMIRARRQHRGDAQNQTQTPNTSYESYRSYFAPSGRSFAHDDLERARRSIVAANPASRFSLASRRLPSTLAPCFFRTVSSIGRASDS